MTTVPILSNADALDVAAELAADFAVGAAKRDQERILPAAELDRLGASGLLAITVPAAFGGGTCRWRRSSR
jgi:alkylation response protein AidB-like acyl-CoA dehydrogenase